MPTNNYKRLDDDGLLYLLQLLKTNIDTAGEENVIETVKVNGVPLVPDAQKAVDIILTAYALAADVPTTTSDLTNDSDYQTGTDLQDANDAALADITGIDFEVVQALPQTGEKGVIYLLSNSGTSPNVYDEYIWIEPTAGQGQYEKIGTTAVDLSGYVQASEMHALTNAEIDTIFNQVFT